MGISGPHPLLVSLGFNGVISKKEDKGGLPWNYKVWGEPGKRSSRAKVRKQIRRRPRSILMKRRAGQEGSRRRHPSMVERKVRTLKKLIPNSECKGLEGIFKETADYIVSLQMRVNVMQILVKVLTGSED